jgi:hypothetical protein
MGIRESLAENEKYEDEQRLKRSDYALRILLPMVKAWVSDYIRPHDL